MTCTLGIVKGDRYGEVATTPYSLRDVWTGRIRIFYELAEKLKNVVYIQPQPARREDLLYAHTEDYIEYVAKESMKGRGYLDYGDTPSYKGVYEDVLLLVGGTLKALEHVHDGKVDHAFAPNGGFHHAEASSAGGFCVFNDVAIAARKAVRDYGLERVAIIDIDGHHGNGTQWILYKDPILKFSFHRYGGYFYPGTGWIDERGEGAGEGYNYNIPLPAGSGDDAFLYALENLVVPILEGYRPEAIIAQLGADGHRGDPLVGLNLTIKTYATVGSHLHKIAHKYNSILVGTGGGGYQYSEVAKAWLTIAKSWIYRWEDFWNMTGEVEGTVSDSSTMRMIRDIVEKHWKVAEQKLNIELGKK